MSSYRVSVPEENLLTLKIKLAQAEFPDELEDARRDLGPPLAEIQRLVHVWKTKFDWRLQEAKLNELPNFHQQISISNFGSLDIHYLHAPSESPNAIPLLFVHGWPGSYIEVQKMLNALRTGRNGVAFHVVAPSLPNFGWSQGPKKTGFGLAQYAETCDKLMQALGYKEYVTQGGDWGFMITRTMGLLYPERVKASHINLVRGHKPSWTKHPILALQNALTPFSEADRKGFERSNWFLTEGSGYRTIQSTKPQTVGYGLHDSPVALLAWIYEKLVDWTDSYAWTDDEILTWVSIYYFSTAGPAASLRIYYEATHPKGPDAVNRTRTEEWIPYVKLGLCHSPREISVTPSIWAHTLGPVAYESRKTRGGHFAAHEIPEEIMKDLFTMFGKGGKCYKIIAAKPKL
ncbi:uncharacterized protein MYCFIDRAFT_75393 [Pseudocercospora fijiensis CIRAD86]|uniref:Epoxide hydrolase N-terminal domain-containing protein n=1 Tax=Pseudocercospora fijiensis (strain CIRAD86) TaxID=383855 RepID=N1Q7F4_PSEFD|nr:uncharacterized protein MYCFIDRAFT_75393 [Pseudocercospora fijiensis CIRAD86]EME87546.1 hypothetical protein MYCFIDRAFT_75393 [Pseudocercospora fijiensis CIRAD86]